MLNKSFEEYLIDKVLRSRTFLLVCLICICIPITTFLIDKRVPSNNIVITYLTFAYNENIILIFLCPTLLFAINSLYNDFIANDIVFSAFGSRKSVSMSMFRCSYAFTVALTLIYVLSVLIICFLIFPLSNLDINSLLTLLVALVGTCLSFLSFGQMSLIIRKLLGFNYFIIVQLFLIVFSLIDTPSIGKYLNPFSFFFETEISNNLLYDLLSKSLFLVSLLAGLYFVSIFVWSRTDIGR